MIFHPGKCRSINGMCMVIKMTSFHLDFMLVFFSRNVGLSSCYVHVDANHVMKLRFHRSDFSSYQMSHNLYLNGKLEYQQKS